MNVRATINALTACLAEIDVAKCLLFTDAEVDLGDKRITKVAIPRLSSARAYSEFMLSRLSDYIETSHCLIVQWDGFVLSGARWNPSFLHFDYIGAPWPQFHDGHNVGNGGFSLRSKKLLQATRDPAFRVVHPEDVAICRVNRKLLEREHGVRFADTATAERFSFERSGPSAAFGFHGIFNLANVVGVDGFWQIYQSLDDRSTAFADYKLLMKQLRTGEQSGRRRLRLSVDRFAALAAGQ